MIRIAAFSKGSVWKFSRIVHENVYGRNLRSLQERRKKKDGDRLHRKKAHSHTSTSWLTDRVESTLRSSPSSPKLISFYWILWSHEFIRWFEHSIQLLLRWRSLWQSSFITFTESGIIFIYVFHRTHLVSHWHWRRKLLPMNTLEITGEVTIFYITSSARIYRYSIMIMWSLHDENSFFSDLPK